MAEKLLKGSIKVDSVLTMGIYQYYKWDAVWRDEHAKGVPLTETEFKKDSDNFSERNWADFSDTTERTLTEYRGNEQKWLVPILQGVIAAFIYSVMLVIVL